MMAATKGIAARAKLQAKIMHLDSKVTSAKKDFGLAVFDLMRHKEAEAWMKDTAVSECFQQCVESVEAMEAQIAQSREAITMVDVAAGAVQEPPC